MEYRTFQHTLGVGAHKINVPIFVPATLFSGEDFLISALSENGFIMSDKGSSCEIGREGHTLDDSIEIARVCFGTNFDLEMLTKIQTDSDHDSYIEAYRKSAGDEADAKLLQKYEKPLSRISPQDGIYFSPQDCVQLELRLLAPGTDTNLCYIAMTDRAHLYFCPRIATGSGDGKNLISSMMRKYLEESDSRFEKSMDSLKSTKQGLELFRKFIEAAKLVK